MQFEIKVILIKILRLISMLSQKDQLQGCQQQNWKIQEWQIFKTEYAKPQPPAIPVFIQSKNQ